ncbi:MAG: hypothetical protein ABH843_07250 [Candidatus Omnitrophota bacterium]
MLDYLLIFLQGIFAFFVFIVPGFCLWIAAAKKISIKEVPLAVELAISFLISSVFVSILQYLTCYLMKPKASAISAVLFILFTIILFLKYARPEMARRLRSIDKWERSTIALLAAVFFFCLFSMPLSPYPAQEPLGLGDPPAYYRVVTNLIHGKGFLQDYFLTGSETGVYFYFKGTPILFLVTSIFFKIFGENWYSLFIYNTLSSMLAFYLLALAVFPDNESRRGRNILFLVCLSLSVPLFFFLASFGTIVLSGALIFILVIYLSKNESITNVKLRHSLIALCLLYLWCVRPEAKFVAILYICIYLPFNLYSKLKRKNHKVLALATVLILMILFWWNIPYISKTALEKHATIAYYKYSSEDDSFKIRIPGELTTVDKMKSYDHMAGTSRADSLRNESIGREIRAHPWAFVKYLFDNYYYSANVVALMTYAPGFLFERTLNTQRFVPFLIVTLIILYSAIGRRYRLIVSIIFFYMLTIRIINSWAHIRHFFIISLPLLGVFLCRIRDDLARLPRNTHRKTPSSNIVFNTTFIALAAIIVFNSVTTVSLRLDERNRRHIPILKAVREYTRPEDKIVSNFPILITCMTSRYTIGAMNIVELLPIIIRYMNPDVIVIDNARKDGAKNYSIYKKFVKSVYGYKEVYSDDENEFVLLKRE